MTNNSYKNLSGKILIATPYELTGGIYYKSLIYIISHTKGGSVGLIVNQLVKSLPLSLFLNQEPFFQDNPIPKDEIKIDKLLPIFFGGPNEIERMFFLHSNDYDKNLLFKSESSGIALSSDPQILKDISLGHGPKNNVSVVGYTLWGEGELEDEVQNNFWIISEYDKTLIFSNMLEGRQKWDLALKNIGITNTLFTSSIGNA